MQATHARATNHRTAYLAHAVTAFRVLAIPIFIWLVRAAEVSAIDPSFDGTPSPIVKPYLFGWIAGVIFAFAAASDIADGPLARRAGAASNAGRFFDHFADIGFILAALSTYAALGIAPWWVPASIAGAFSFYVVDSLRQSARAPSLIGSRLGHWGGIANYVLIGVLVFNHSAGIELLSPLVMRGLFVLVPMYSLGAVVARLMAR